MFKIHNEIFCLTISKLGAELEELCVNGINILWKRSAIWNGQSPILFPIVGNLKDGYYIYNEQKYEMAAHGFLKDVLFEPVKVEQSLITLKSAYTEDTFNQYPFQYEFYITYALVSNKIKIKFEIKNLEEKTMFFSCGFHPGFDLEQVERLLGKNLYLEFSPLQVQSVQFNPQFTEKISSCNLPSQKTLTEFSQDLAIQKTVCYQGLNQIHLSGEDNSLRINHNLDYTAFWQKNPDPKFICIEPWSGLPDEEFTDHQLIHKKSIQALEARKTFEYEIELSFLEGVKK